MEIGIVGSVSAINTVVGFLVISNLFIRLTASYTTIKENVTTEPDIKKNICNRFIRMKL